MSRLVRVLAVSVVVSVLAGTGGGASAETVCGRALRDAIEVQDQEIARTGGVKAALLKAENKAKRSGDVVTLFLLARAYGKAGASANAIQTFSEVIRAAPDCAPAFRSRGVLVFVNRNAPGVAADAVRQAEADLRRAVALDPAYGDAFQDLGELLIEQKRYEDAVRTLVRALELDPSNEQARVQVVRAYLAWNKPTEALATLEPMLARSSNPDPGLRLIRARAWAMQGKHAEAQGALLQIARELPDRPEPLREWLAVAAARKTWDPKEGVNVLERLARLTRGEEQAKWRAEIATVRKHIADRAAAESAAASGPVKVTPDLLTKMLRSPDGKVRQHALLHLSQRDEADFGIGGELFLALLERLKDADPENRGHALVVLARWGDPERAPMLAAIVRALLRDPDARVRSRAADTLATIRSALPVPYLYSVAIRDLSSVHEKDLLGDLEVATAARMAVYEIARVAPPAAETTPAAQSAAFSAWWGSEAARAVKLAAIKDIRRARDANPDELLYVLATDRDPEVWPVAYRALVAASRGAPPKVAGWMSTLPLFPDDVLVAARRDEVVTALSAWWVRRPKS